MKRALACVALVLVIALAGKVGSAAPIRTHASAGEPRDYGVMCGPMGNHAWAHAGCPRSPLGVTLSRFAWRRIDGSSQPALMLAR